MIDMRNMINYFHDFYEIDSQTGYLVSREARDAKNVLMPTLKLIFILDSHLGKIKNLQI